MQPNFTSLILISYTESMKFEQLCGIYTHLTEQIYLQKLKDRLIEAGDRFRRTGAERDKNRMHIREEAYHIEHWRLNHPNSDQEEDWIMDYIINNKIDR